MPIVQPRITPISIRELSVALSQCLKREEGRGKNCTVEYFRRRDAADVFVAYPDDFVQTIVLHDDQGRLVPRSHSSDVRDRLCASRPRKGRLNCLPSGAGAQTQARKCFCPNHFGNGSRPEGQQRPFDLNRLKDRYFCLETDPCDHVSASISRLRLDVPKYGRFTVEPSGSGRACDVFEVIDECLNSRAVRWEDVNISLATFRFEFAGQRPAERIAVVGRYVSRPLLDQQQASRADRADPKISPPMEDRSCLTSLSGSWCASTSARK